MNKLKLFFIFHKFLIIIICIPALFLYQDAKSFGENFKINNSSDFVIIKNQKIFVDVAYKPQQLMKGLMFIDELPENNGMIFLFSNVGYKNFWMKNMKISLDMLFIYKDKIVNIYKGVPVCKNDPCPIYESKYKINSVLELKTNFCDKYNIKIGDKVKFSRNIIIKTKS